MNQLNRNELILIELEKTELMDINGGKVAYWYSDDGTIVFFTMWQLVSGISLEINSSAKY